MGDRDISRGFTLLDLGAMIMGAAIASIHVRLVAPSPRGAIEWGLVAALFAWLTITAAGPFLYMVRRFHPRGDPTYPRIGDRLWVLWGCPWVVSALAESALVPTTADRARLDSIYVGSLGLGLFLATMVAVPLLAARYLWGDPAAAGRTEATAWTQWVGLALSAAWPIQCGVGLVLMG